jgi:hypothetical protein
MGALVKWLHSRPQAAQPAERTPAGMEDLRRLCLDALADCVRAQDERARGQLARAATPQQLWLLRCEIYQAVAQRHCEAEAARRVNGLLPAFAGWLPDAALTRL